MRTLTWWCQMAGQSSPSPKILYPEWQDKFQAALLEVDLKNLLQKIKQAEMGILDRIKALSLSSREEAGRQAIENALGVLQLLKREKLP